MNSIRSLRAMRGSNKTARPTRLTGWLFPAAEQLAQAGRPSSGNRFSGLSLSRTP